MKLLLSETDLPIKENLPRRRRIRCRNCGYRIPADSKVCPHCGENPRLSAKALLARVGILLLGGLLGLGACWVGFRVLTANGLALTAGSEESPPSPTATLQIIFVQATLVPPTPTLEPTATATSTPTPTPQFSPTPTRRDARTPTLTLTATRAGPTPTSPSFPAPSLLGPPNLSVFTGETANIFLNWQSVTTGGLPENEWYAISISFTLRDGKSEMRRGWSREAGWNVPKTFYGDASPKERAFKWNVTVMRVEGADPYTSPSQTPASPTSVTWTFFWNQNP